MLIKYSFCSCINLSRLFQDWIKILLNTPGKAYPVKVLHGKISPPFQGRPFKSQVKETNELSCCLESSGPEEACSYFRFFLPSDKEKNSMEVFMVFNSISIARRNSVLIEEQGAVDSLTLLPCSIWDARTLYWTILRH